MRESHFTTHRKICLFRKSTITYLVIPSPRCWQLDRLPKRINYSREMPIVTWRGQMIIDMHIGHDIRNMYSNAQDMYLMVGLAPAGEFTSKRLLSLRFCHNKGHDLKH